MTHCFLTIAIPMEEAKVAATNASLDDLGNPAIDDVRKRMAEDLQIHFVAISAISGDGAGKAHLVIEASSDADARDTIALLVTRLDRWLRPVFAAAGLSASNPADMLGRYVVKSGNGLGDNAGLDFTGTPGMSVKRIRAEYRLARRVRDLFESNTYRGSAVEILAQAREDVARDPELAPLLTLEPAPFLVELEDTSTLLTNLPGLVFGALRKYFWPLLLFDLLLVVAATAAAWNWYGGVAAVLAALIAFGLGVMLLVAVLVIIYAGLRKRETADVPDDSIPDDAVLTEVVRRENKSLLNHMTGVSRMKPGRLRRFTIKLAFFVSGTLSGRFRPGYLAGIGTINFARWVLLPGTNQLLFFWQLRRQLGKLSRGFRHQGP